MIGLRRSTYLVAILLVSILLLSIPALAEVDSNAFDKGFQLLRTTMSLIKSESREVTTTRQLVNAAIDGMTLAIEATKQKAGFLQHVAEDVPDEQAILHLREQYKQAAERFPELFKSNELTIEAAQGMLKSVDDPYTVFLTPIQYRMLNESMSGGNFGGLGVTINQSKDNGGQLTVVEVLEDSPASKAGLRRRDVISAIEGKPTKGLLITDSSALLRGKPGSKVKLTIERPGADEPFTVVATREIIHISSVSSKMLNENGCKIGYMQVKMFGESTNLEAEKALQALDKQGAQAYILDIRNNSGGYVSAALDLCSKFLPTGSRVVSIVERNRAEQVMYSRPSLRRQNRPIIVLVNGDSASASEITAGALKDLHRAELVGEKTYGKGSVQKIYPQQFPEGELSALKITTAHYHTPNGTDIHKSGIMPDYEVALTENDIEKSFDPQLQKAIDVVVAQINKNVGVKPEDNNNHEVVSVNGMNAQLEYLQQKLSGQSSWHVIERKVVFEADTIFENVRVRLSDGTIKTYKFDLSPTIGL